MGQKTGIINDPDGYTNIRRGQGVDHEVVGRIEEADQFKYYPNKRSDWWKIETMPYFGEPVIGFVYKSRIQPYYLELSNNCKCPTRYGQGEAIPVLKAEIGNTTVTVCGYLKQRHSEHSIKISEFTISDCQTNKVIRFYGAVTTCEVIYTGEALEIVELDQLPVGKNFQWVETPCKKVKITNDSGDLKFTNEQLAINLSRITEKDINSFVHKLPAYKDKGYFEGVEDFIGKLLVCALAGSEQCQKVFYDIESHLNFAFDGAFKKFYDDCKLIMEEDRSP